jgi:phosphotransferase system  glucose/maltose/N-acetylglucosamine-specific IIC component
MWIAIAHIAGAVFAGFMVAVLTLLLGIWLGNKSAAAELEVVSAKLGFTDEDLENKDNFYQATSLMYERYSNDRLGNRLSDFCGWIQTAVDWVVLLAQIAILISVIWFTAKDTLENAIYAWCIPAISLLSFAARMLFSFFCRILTGRYPGQAKSSRKALADMLKAQREAKKYPFLWNSDPD